MGSGQLEKRNVLVTGAATGIGRAIVRVVAGEGARVAISDIDERGAEALAREIGGSAFAIRVDVTKREEIEAAIEAAAAKFGGLDTVIANAGVSTMNPVVDLTEEEWDFNMAVNAKGVFLTNQAAVKHFLGTGTKGVIVNVASLAAKVGAPLLAHYSASKFAVVGFTQGLAREVAKDGIRANCVCPGFVRTGMQDREVAWEAELRGMTPEDVRAEYVQLTPLGRLEEPEDVADVVVFLAGEGARFMTGQAINVTGGVYMG